MPDVAVVLTTESGRSGNGRSVQIVGQSPQHSRWAACRQGADGEAIMASLRIWMSCAFHIDRLGRNSIALSGTGPALAGGRSSAGSSVRGNEHGVGGPVGVYPCRPHRRSCGAPEGRGFPPERWRGNAGHSAPSISVTAGPCNDRNCTPYTVDRNHSKGVIQRCSYAEAGAEAASGPTSGARRIGSPLSIPSVGLKDARSGICGPRLGSEPHRTVLTTR